MRKNKKYTIYKIEGGRKLYSKKDDLFPTYENPFKRTKKQNRIIIWVVLCGLILLSRKK
jgi:hypothetical protein